MTLNRAKELLLSKNIPFEIVEYKNGSDFWKHILLFPNTKHADSSKVMAIVIKSNNKQKNLELQFNESKEGFLFQELWFGDYSFEAFDYGADVLEQEILADIERVMSDTFIACSLNDLKKKRWLADGLVEKDDEDAKKIQQKILKPKSWIEKLFKTQLQYEIYDWNNYQIIIK